MRRGARAALGVVLLACAAAAGACGKGKAGAVAVVGAGDAAAPPEARVELAAIARAEDQRRAKDVPEDARVSHDVVTRRRAARALARIADAASVPGLVRALDDEDSETVAWGAYGLGETCKVDVDGHVRALAARAASLGDVAADAAALAPRGAIARAIGRCGGDVAEATLASWVRSGTGAEDAAFALGDVAGARHRLADETSTSLLDAATGRPESPPRDAALYPFTRLDKVPQAFRERVLAAARAALGRPGEARIFAVRALARCGGDAAADLSRVVTDKSGYLPAERAAAATSLGTMGKEGRDAAADALAYLAPDKDPIGIGALGGDEYGVMTSLLHAIGPEPPKKLDATLYALAALVVPGDATDALRARIAKIRCAAAGALARGAFDEGVLRRCDDPSSEASEQARLDALLAHPTLAGERRAAWAALARSAHPRVREAALEAIEHAPELREAGRAALAEALASGKPGVVATAAEVLFVHPERADTLARSEIRAALDPNAPPPTTHPTQEVDPAIAKALAGALARAWPEDLVETRVALFQAGIALGMKEGKEAAMAACRDANATLRAKAEAALRVADPSVACKPPDAAPPPAPELDAPLAHAVKVTFAIEGGSALAVTFDPALAPIAATRLVALARSGFYDGVVVHRVVPGFVAQLGDPGGDGYGGAGRLLRCETSPVPFGALDVGIALAGRDTGSSQIFVTLARAPHLDGGYTRVGRAEGDWWAVAEGDVVRSARVEE